MLLQERVRSSWRPDGRCYREVDVDRLATVAPQLLVLDANRFLGSTLGNDRPLSSRCSRTAAGMSQPLAGRNAVITGANQGLGLAIADAYVAAGASVLLCARDETLLDDARRSLAAKAGPGPDRSRPSALMSRARRTSHESRPERWQIFPQVHVLVNNAGIYGPLGPSEEVDWAAWVRAMEINVYGSVLPCRALLPHFKQHRYGKIVQLSGGGATNPLPRISAYAASKAADRSFCGVARPRGQAVRHRRERDCPWGAQYANARRSRRSRPRRGRTGFLRSHGQTRRNRAGRHSSAAPRWPSISDRQRAMALPVGCSAPSGIRGRTSPARREDLDGSDVYTLRRIVPKDRGFTWGDR